MDWQQVCSAARRMTAEEVVTAEAAVAADPEDLVARVRLVGFHAAQLDRAVGAIVHVHWLIDHRPELVLGPFGSIRRHVSLRGFEDGKSRWLAQVANAPTNTTILENAVMFLFMDERAVARELVLRGIALAPSAAWHRWMTTLVWQAWSRTLSTAERAEHAAEIVTHCELALTFVESDAGRYRLHVELAHAATEAGLVKKALEAARHLAQGRDTADARYWSSIAIGMANLHVGDVAAARTHLAAAASSGAVFSVLPFDQPDLSLASALLERAERDAAIAYLAALETSWSEHADEIRVFRERIEQGETPDLDEIRRRAVAQTQHRDATLTRTRG